jgi:hypothetical protein
MRIRAIILFFLFIAANCQTISQYRVNGFFGENYYGFQTTVDSKIAHDYLYTSYPGKKENNQINDIFLQWDKKELNQKNLKDLSKITSTDFATLYFSKRILDNPSNRKAQTRFDEILTSLKENDYFKKNVNRNTLFIFVPGLGYKTDKEIGADFSTQRKALQDLGIPNTIIEVDEFGRVPANAQIIADNIVSLSRTYSSIILISASKSSSEVAIALGKILKPEQTQNVKAWLSLCGVLRGTPFVKPFQKGIIGFLTNVYLTFHGSSTEMLNDMTPEYMNEVYDTLVFPSHIKLVQYVPIALSGQITSRAFSGYNGMKSEGPNDGRALLADQLIGGGTVLLSFGSDHYFKDNDIVEKSMALGIFTQELFENSDYQARID